MLDNVFRSQSIQRTSYTVSNTQYIHMYWSIRSTIETLFYPIRIACAMLNLPILFFLQFRTSVGSRIGVEPFYGVCSGVFCSPLCPVQQSPPINRGVCPSCRCMLFCTSLSTEYILYSIAQHSITVAQQHNSYSMAAWHILTPAPIPRTMVIVAEIARQRTECCKDRQRERDVIHVLSCFFLQHREPVL